MINCEEKFLKIVVLNVQHGDSIVIQYYNGEESFWGIIDSNFLIRKGKRTIPAMEYLQKREVKKLSFLALTHLHQDHFQGLGEICKRFPIETVILPPHFGSDFGDYVKTQSHKFHKALRKIGEKSGGNSLARLESLVEFLLFLKDRNEENCIIFSGPENRFRPSSFEGMELMVVQPLNFMKPKFFQALSDGKIDFSNPSINELSMAFFMKIGDNQILLGGDSSRMAWLRRKNFHKEQKSFDSRVSKLPHHGSQQENSPLLLDYFFGNSKEQKFAIISANGISHPAEEVLLNLEKKQIFPYCTCLSQKCALNTSKCDFSGGERLHPGLRENLFFFKTFQKPLSCQGDIEIVFNKQASEIITQYRFPCPYQVEK